MLRLSAMALAACLGGNVALASAPSCAQIKIIVPFSAGGAST
jgi:tripartite-type tricarboxylate transporter receptor subunit TctC